MPPKKKGPLFWILIGLGAFMLLGIIAVGLISLTAWRMMQSVSDSDNPAFAAAKLALRLNPDLEIVSEDSASGRVTVRSKKTGEVTTMTIDPDSKTFRVETQDGKGGSVQIEDGKAVFTGQDGTTVITGEGGTLPSWLPAYPGTQPSGTMTADTPNGKTRSYGFKTSDSAEKVLNFYKGELQSMGFSVPTTMIQASSGMIMAQDEANKRQVMVSMSGNEGVLTVTERQ